MWLKSGFYWQNGGVIMNKLYDWDLYDRRKLDMNRLYSTRNDAWVTSGCVLAENIEEAKLKLAECFDMGSGKYILNFDLGEEYIKPYYIQDNKNKNVFIEKFLIKEED